MLFGCNQRNLSWVNESVNVINQINNFSIKNYNCKFADFIENNFQ